MFRNIKYTKKEEEEKKGLAIHVYVMSCTCISCVKVEKQPWASGTVNYGYIVSNSINS